MTSYSADFVASSFISGTLRVVHLRNNLVRIELDDCATVLFPRINGYLQFTKSGEEWILVRDILWQDNKSLFCRIASCLLPRKNINEELKSWFQSICKEAEFLRGLALIHSYNANCDLEECIGDIHLLNEKVAYLQEKSLPRLQVEKEKADQYLKDIESSDTSGQVIWTI